MPYCCTLAFIRLSGCLAQFIFSFYVKIYHPHTQVKLSAPLFSTHTANKCLKGKETLFLSYYCIIHKWKDHNNFITS